MLKVKNFILIFMFLYSLSFSFAGLDPTSPKFCDHYDAKYCLVQEIIDPFNQTILKETQDLQVSNKQSENWFRSLTLFLSGGTDIKENLASKHFESRGEGLSYSSQHFSKMNCIFGGQYELKVSYGSHGFTLNKQYPLYYCLTTKDLLKKTPIPNSWDLTSDEILVYCNDGARAQVPQINMDIIFSNTQSYKTCIVKNLNKSEVVVSGLDSGNIFADSFNQEDYYQINKHAGSILENYNTTIISSNYQQYETTVTASQIEKFTASNTLTSIPFGGTTCTQGVVSIPSAQNLETSLNKFYDIVPGSVRDITVVDSGTKANTYDFFDGSSNCDGYSWKEIQYTYEYIPYNSSNNNITVYSKLNTTNSNYSFYYDRINSIYILSNNDNILEGEFGGSSGSPNISDARSMDELMDFDKIPELSRIIMFKGKGNQKIYGTETISKKVNANSLSIGDLLPLYSIEYENINFNQSVCKKSLYYLEGSPIQNSINQDRKISCGSNNIELNPNQLDRGSVSAGELKYGIKNTNEDETQRDGSSKSYYLFQNILLSLPLN